MLICSCFSCFALVKAADWNHFLPWESHQASAERENSVLLLWQESGQMSTFSLWLSPCLLITRENHRLLFPRRVFLHRNKSSDYIHTVGGGDRQIKPGQSCCDLVGLALSACAGWAVCHLAPPVMEQQSCCCPVARASLDLWYAVRLGCNFPSFLEPKGCCACLQSAGWAGDDLQSKASVIWAQFCFLSLMVWQLVTVGAPQYDANPPDLLWSSGEKKIPIKVFLSFIHSFLLLFKAENQSAVHTRALLTSFPFHLSIQQPVII